MIATDQVREFLREAGRKGGAAGKGKVATRKKASKAAKAKWKKIKARKALEKESCLPLNSPKP